MAFPNSNADERVLVHQGNACTSMSVVPSVLCENEGELCSLEDKNSDQNLFEDLF